LYKGLHEVTKTYIDCHMNYLTKCAWREKLGSLYPVEAIKR